jgi:hypothetical protein
MHADFHELSEVAAGRREAGSHIRGCEDCHAGLQRLRSIQGGLRSHAPLAPPASTWAGVQARLERRAEARAQAPTPAAYGMAASLAVIALTALLFTGRPQGSAGQPTVDAAPVPLDGLVAQNARLEAYLADLPQPRTTRIGTAYTVAAIEDRLAYLDDRITAVALEPNAPEVAEDLWRERLTLMNSLVRVRYANALASR